MEGRAGHTPQADCDHSHQTFFPGDGVARYLGRVQQEKVAPSSESHDVAAVAKLAKVPVRASDGTKMANASTDMEVMPKATPVDEQGGAHPAQNDIVPPPGASSGGEW